MTTTAAQRQWRAERLAQAAAHDLEALAEDFLATLGAPVVDGPPTTGLVMLQVREPVCGDRFHLGEVLVTESKVLWRGASGWAMRLGSDREATLSAALCDAASQIDAEAARRVDALCDRVGASSAAASEAEWSELLRTRVRFEELD